MKAKIDLKIVSNPFKPMKNYERFHIHLIDRVQPRLKLRGLSKYNSDRGN